MITIESQHNVGDRLGKISFELRGLSTDEKPTETYGGANIANGSIFLEMDTQKIWFYDEATSAWVGNEEE
jgi:hypothetical protein